MPEIVGVSSLVTLLGAGSALAFVRAPLLLRAVILAGLLALLALPAPLLGLPQADVAPFGVACAAGRAVALVALICVPSAAAIPPGLRRAALAAGATPLRAWRDAVLAQVWVPAVLGLAAAWLRR